MAVYTTPQIRVSINDQSRTSVRTVGVAAKTRFKINEIEDVVAFAPQNNDTLVYDESLEKYVVKTLPSLDGGTY
jgi:hypothetical protein